MANKIRVPREDVMPAVDEYGEEDTPFELVEQGDWIQDYKYQWRENILKRVSDDTFWVYDEGRTGSPFTEYYYNDQDDEFLDLYQVEKKEVVTTEWVRI